MKIGKLLMTTSLVAGMAGPALAQGKTFSEVDTDGNGMLSKEELTAAFGSESAQRILMRIDSDDDDQLSMQEVRDDDESDDDDEDDDEYDDESDDDESDDDESDDDESDDDDSDDDSDDSDESDDDS